MCGGLLNAPRVWRFSSENDASPHRDATPTLVDYCFGPDSSCAGVPSSRAHAWYYGDEEGNAHLLIGINANKGSLDHVVQLLQKNLPGVYVVNVEVGNGAQDSLRMPVPEQVLIYQMSCLCF